MKDKWIQWKARFEAFETRERLLIVGAIVAAVYLLWDFILLQPMGKEMQVLVARERVARQTLQTGDTEFNIISGLVTKDPNIELRREIEELREKLLKLDRDLDTVAVGLVPAQQLPRVMHSVLSKTGKLRITNMTTLPPEEIVLSPGAVQVEATEVVAKAGEAGNPGTVAAPATEDAGAKIFKHGAIFNIEGDFSSVVQYLKDLEKSDWKFYWDTLRYEVKNYPDAQIQLRVFTLSSQRGVLDGA